MQVIKQKITVKNGIKGHFLIEETEDTLRKVQNEAIYWVQDYLARRSHSEKELKEKLRQKGFESSIAEHAIQYAREQNWMDDPYELSEKVYKEWDRKSKSHSWILNYLSEKGLPTEISKDVEREKEKALHHLEKRFESMNSFNYNKAASGLSSKGFLYDEFSSALEIFKQQSKDITFNEG